jgi:hypothetical protein
MDIYKDGNLVASGVTRWCTGDFQQRRYEVHVTSPEVGPYNLATIQSGC